MNSWILYNVTLLSRRLCSFAPLISVIFPFLFGHWSFVPKCTKIWVTILCNFMFKLYGVS